MVWSTSWCFALYFRLWESDRQKHPKTADRSLLVVFFLGDSQPKTCILAYEFVICCHLFLGRIVAIETKLQKTIVKSTNINKLQLRRSIESLQNRGWHSAANTVAWPKQQLGGWPHLCGNSKTRMQECKPERLLPSRDDGRINLVWVACVWIMYIYTIYKYTTNR